jgi:DNA-binding CsgD family transcriptional regulator
MDACSEVLYKTLLERVLIGLPSGESADGERVRATSINAREELRYRFLEMLMRDRLEYVESLDFSEIRFAMALATLRAVAQRKVYRKDNPLDPIEIDQETGEIAEKVERAAGSFDPFENENIDDYFYRLRLDKAIDALPPMQKAIVEMIRKGIPIESKQPGKVDIAKTLGKTEKTVRTHRDQAYATLRRALTKGEK